MMPDENNRSPMDVFMSLMNSQTQGNLDSDVLIGVLALLDLLSIVSFLNTGAPMRGQGSEIDGATWTGAGAGTGPAATGGPGSVATDSKLPTDLRSLGELIGNLAGRAGQSQAQSQTQSQAPDMSALVNMLASQFGSKINPSMLPALINLLSAYMKQKGAAGSGQGQAANQAAQNDQKD